MYYYCKIAMEKWLEPELSAAGLNLLRSGYGLLLLGTLAMALPQCRRFFVSDRWGGFAKSTPAVNAIQNPYLLPFTMALWFASALALLFDYYSVLAGFVNLLLCRYFFIHLRWRGVLRGMGAPGFMTYWLAACVFFLDYGRHYDPAGRVHSAALFAFQVDLAFIMLSAGTYKLFAGYAQNRGMELGMVNPWWGYWWRFYKRIPPDNWVFKILNHLAWSTEVVAAVLMLIPPTRLLGAFLIFASFVFIATHIRLGFLCEMVMLSTFVFAEAGSWADRMFTLLWPAGAAGPELASSVPPPVNQALVALLCAYVALLPLAHGGLDYNFFARRSLPALAQKLLERYTNLFGIIMWRVFTIDVINFFVRIFVVHTDGSRREYTSFGDFDWASRFRYNHVGEFVCFASLFTTLKYYSSNQALFEERLLRYAATIPAPPGARLLFEYNSIRRSEHGFDFVPAAEYWVDVAARRVEERVLDQTVDVRAAAPTSPVHEGKQPGSYAPLTVR